jgi:hypothetical protein
MVFGDVNLHHPELHNQIPDEYRVPRLDLRPAGLVSFGSQGSAKPANVSGSVRAPCVEHVVSPPDGAVRNIMGLVLEGVRQGAEGMLLCDWGDHGSYTLPGFLPLRLCSCSPGRVEGERAFR